METRTMTYQGAVSKIARIEQEPLPARPLLRIGAACACLGGAMAVIGNALHGPADVTMDGLRHLAHNGVFGIYGADHFLLAIAVVFVSNGLAAIAQSVEAEPGASWARLGFVNVLIGGAVMLAALGIDGFALVPMARSWLDASAADQRTLFQIAQALFSAFIGMFALAVFVFFGCVPLLYGTAFLTGRVYPRWIGIAAIAGGLVGLPLGMALAFAWITSLVYMILFGISATLFAIWVIAAGIVLWRRTTPAF
jgi:hypothetical protein